VVNEKVASTALNLGNSSRGGNHSRLKKRGPCQRPKLDRFPLERNQSKAEVAEDFYLQQLCDPSRARPRRAAIGEERGGRSVV